MEKNYQNPEKIVKVGLNYEKKLLQIIENWKKFDIYMGKKCTKIVQKSRRNVENCWKIDLNHEEKKTLKIIENWEKFDKNGL